MTSPTVMGKGAAAPVCTVCGKRIKRTEYRRNGGNQPKWVHTARGPGERHKVQVSDRGVGHIKCGGCDRPAADHDCYWLACCR